MVVINGWNLPPVLDGLPIDKRSLFATGIGGFSVIRRVSSGTRSFVLQGLFPITQEKIIHGPFFELRRLPASFLVSQVLQR